MTLLFAGILKINLVFTLEFLTLLAAIWFLAYAHKEQLSKWYRYAAIFVITVISAIILCTAVNMFCQACGSGCGSTCNAKCERSCGPHGGFYHHGKGHKKSGCDYHHKKWKKYHHKKWDKKEDHKKMEHPKGERRRKSKEAAKSDSVGT